MKFKPDVFFHRLKYMAFNMAFLHIHHIINTYSLLAFVFHYPSSSEHLAIIWLKAALALPIN